MKTKQDKRRRRHLSIRRKVAGTPERPRLSVMRTQRHLYAQIVDDSRGQTLAFLTTNRKEFKSAGRNFSNAKSARLLGEELGRLAQSRGIARVVFDRGGFHYHGVVKTLADAARAAGLEF